MFSPANWYRGAITLFAALLLLVAAAMSLMEGDSLSDRGLGEVETEYEVSTPRGRLTLFVETTDQIRQRLDTLERERVRSDSLLYPALSEKSRYEMAILTKRMLTSLDLSGIPLAMRENVGIETALMLSESLRLNGVTATTPIVARSQGLWSVGSTHVEIGAAKIDAQHQGYLFTPATVTEAKLLYDAAKASAPAAQATAFDSYRYYMRTPGKLVPPPWAGIVLRLPEAWQKIFGMNTVWQWGAFLFALSGLFAVPAAMSWRVASRHSRIFWVSASLAAYAYFAEGVMVDEFNLSGRAEIACYYLFSFVTYISVALCLVLFFEWLADLMIRKFDVDPTNVDASMLRLGLRMIGVVAAVSVLCVGADQAGIPLVGMITGLGIGGLAAALAAQSTLENLLASIVMFLDRPAKIGDHIEAEDINGVIKRIGLRSTRIQGEDGRVYSITNADLSGRVIVNHSRKNG